MGNAIKCGNCCAPTANKEEKDFFATHKFVSKQSQNTSNSPARSIQIKESAFQPDQGGLSTFGSPHRSSSYANSPAESSNENIRLHGPPFDVAVLVKEVPDYSNPNVTNTKEKLGPFRYNNDQKGDEDLPSLPPFQFVESKTVYKGQWKNGEKYGRGEQWWPDGGYYEGYWKDNMMNGKGRLIHQDGDVYEGDWVNDKAHGYGTHTHMDGAKYEGDWYDDKQHGKGVEIWPDGAKYTGSYGMGKKEGHGSFVWADKSTYDGDFQDNSIPYMRENVADLAPTF